MSPSFKRLLDALVQDGWEITLESATTIQPKLLTVSRGSKVVQLRVYIWNVRPGGGPPGTRPDEEYRIQKMVREPLELGGGRLTLLIGWYEPDDVFAAWDPAAHVSARYSASIQVRAPYIAEAHLRGMAIQHRDQPSENIVVFNANLLSAYLEQAPVIHGRQFSEEYLTFPELDTRLIEENELQGSASQIRPRSNRVPKTGVSQERRRVLNTLTRWWRSTTFPRTVTWAYDYRCAACGIALNLVEAAHIVPITDPKAIEHPSNGLALCPLHHDAYDDGIFGVAEDFKIISNPTKINDLKNRNLEGGLDVFLNITPIGEAIRLPDYEPYRPDPHLLRYSLALRGFIR